MILIIKIYKKPKLINLWNRILMMIFNHFLPLKPYINVINPKIKDQLIKASENQINLITLKIYFKIKLQVIFQILFYLKFFDIRLA